MRYLVSVLFSVIVAAFLLLSPVDGETANDSEDVDIDSYIFIEIDFSSGDNLELDAEISSSNDPISFFLIKGEDEFQRWRDTEEIDIQAILEGENVTDEDDNFTVIKNFSMTNITYFSGSISIGEKDTYYLVIVIFREEGMSKDDILSRGSRVTYDVAWETEERELDVWLLLLAVVIGVIGLALIIYYFRERAKAEEEALEEEPPVDRRQPPQRTVRPPPGRKNMDRTPPTGRRRI